MLRLVGTITFTFIISINAFSSEADVVQAAHDREKAAARAEKTEAVESVYEACKGVALIDNDDYVKNKNYWDNAIQKCGAEQIQIIPKNGFLVSEIHNATKTLGFLQDLGKKTKEALDKNISNMEKVAACFISVSSECESIKDQVKALVKKLQPEARKALAIAGGSAGPYVFNEIDEHGMPSPNDILKIPATKKMVAKELGDGITSSLLPEKLEPMTRSERGQAEEFVAKYASDLNREVNAGKLTAYEAANKFEQMKAAQKMQYIDLLQQAPVLAYLGTTKISGVAGDKAIAKSIEKLLENAKKERDRIAKVIAEGKVEFDSYSDEMGNVNATKRSKSDRSKTMLDFMTYTPMVEEMLKNDPMLCSTAEGLAKHVEKAQLRNMAGVMGGIVAGALVAGVAFPPSLAVLGTTLSGGQLAALALGPPIGLGFVAHDWMNLNKAKQAAWTNIGLEGDQSVAKTEKVEEARSDLNWSVALMPLDFAGTGAFVAAGGSGFFAGRYLMNAAAKKALTKRGLAKEETERLISLSKSDIKNVSEEAKKKLHSAALDLITARTGLKKEADLKKVDKLVETMANKGFAGTPTNPNAQYVEEMLDAIRGMEARGPQFIDNATKVFEELNPAKFNEATRGRTRKAIVAMANYGIDDAKVAGDEMKRFAAILNDWDEGIEGLTQTMELATKKMKSRDIASISDLSLKREKAWDGALDEMRVKNQAFKDMPDEQWAEVRTQMKTCPLGKK